MQAEATEEAWEGTAAERMSSILDEIVAYKRRFVAERRLRVPLEEVRQRSAMAPPVPPLSDALSRAPDAAVIAEIKKASPSKGLIREDFDPTEIARINEDGGASALSVLTDEKFFQGCDDYLTEAGKVVDIPILRKDFVIDAYQIYEARAIGAAAVLLITAILTADEIASHLELCRAVGLDALVETHTEEEVRAAIDSGARIVGINNRDLRTFETHLGTTLRLVERIPDDLVKVSESGIRTREDVVLLRDAGVDAVLVGESLMREPDIGRKLRELLGG